MKISVKTTYRRFDSKRIPFLTKENGKVLNGHWDVTDTPEFLTGVRDTEHKVHLKDYLVYRPVPKAILALREKPSVHPQSFEMQQYYQ